MRLWIFTLISILIIPALWAQSVTVTDIDGNEYQTVQIGNQRWMAQNLRVTRYANGDDLPYLKDATEWSQTKEGAYCYYENITKYMETYGNLYNWYTVVDERGVCPKGWHVPDDTEWSVLEKYLGMSTGEISGMTAWRGTDEGKRLKSESFGGSNSSGFSAMGTGYRDPEGVFRAMGTDNDYWTSTPYDNKGQIEGVLRGFLHSHSGVVRNFHVPEYGFCIRCIRDY